MKFKLQNIGIIKNYELELGNLTVICGKNNTGKTYLSYSIYGFYQNIYNKIITHNFKNFNLQNLRENIIKNETYKINLKELELEIFDLYRDLSNNYSHKLVDIFNTNVDEFNNSNFSIELPIPTNVVDLEFVMPISEDKGKIVKEKNTEFAYLYLPRTNKYINISELELVSENENKFSASQIFFAFTKGRLFLLYKKLIQNVFLISAERSSLQTFQKEIDQYRSRLMFEMQKNKSISITDFSISRFSFPIEQEMNFIRDIDKTIKKNSFIKENYPEIIEYIEEMFGVKYEFLNEQLMINVGNKLIPQYLASSSVRSLADLHIWLKHKASKADLLMIDEPELNLHPENQIKLARLFAKLINIGINVWITTHSDYIVKEINNLLLLSNNFSEKENLMKEFGYGENEILNNDQVKIYISKENGELFNVEIDRYGMSSTTFDETIEKINEVSNSIFNLMD